MNEKQRKEHNNQIKQVDPADVKSGQDNLERLKKKTSEDFIKYFQTTYQPPNINKARKRRKEEVKYFDDFEIPEDLQGFGKGKKFLMRTYGCQMNEHDSEVMSGILMELGYTPTADQEEADVILLNTCAIRENAENKVFGELGHLKALRRESPGLIIGVCGCMSQEESVVNKIL